MSMICWLPSSLVCSSPSFADISMSLKAVVSTFLSLAVGTVETLPMMMFSNAMRSSTDSGVQQTLRHPFLDCEHLCLTSDLADSVLKFVRLVAERPQDVLQLLHVFGSISFSDFAEQRCICLLLTCSSGRISSRWRGMLRTPFCSCVCCILSGSFAVVLCKTGQSDASMVLNSSSVQSTETVLMSSSACTDCVVQLGAQLLCRICHCLSQWLLKGDHACGDLLPRLLQLRNLESPQLVPPVMALIGAPPPCEMQLSFVAQTDSNASVPL